MPAMHATSRRAAFTLLEITIVLTIIGLIAGGVYAGRELIRVSEVQQIAEKFSQYSTAVSSFRGQYKAWPGDMPNATSYWAAVDPTPATCIATASNGTTTCNGNGNGIIGDDVAGTVGLFSERWHFWIHLANAGLIPPYAYTGVNAGPPFAAGVPAPGQNSPSIGSVRQASFSNMYLLPMGETWHFDLDRPSNVLNFANAANTALTPVEMQGFDRKLDDGRPGYGIVQALTPTANNGCASTNDRNTAIYNTTDADLLCAVLYFLQ